MIIADVMKHPIHLVSKSLALLAVIPVSLHAGLVFNVDFNAYEVEDTFTSPGLSSDGSTDFTIQGAGGSRDDKLTRIYGDSGEWTATVRDSGTASGRLLEITTPAGYSSGGLEFFRPQGLSSQTGTWYAQFDYTRLTESGGPLGIFYILSNGGTPLGNCILYADNWGGDQALAYNTSYTLRMEVDMGSSAADSFRVYCNDFLVGSSQNSGSAGAEIGGLSFVFNAYYEAPTARTFTLDNIQFGLVAESSPVPESETAALVLAGGVLVAAFVWSRHRSR
jgi:hypothetical protein